MKKETYLSTAKTALFLFLVTLLGSCTDQLNEGITILPEGKYPVAFSSATYGLEVDTRAVSDNSTWTGGEEVAVSFGYQGVKQYTAAADNKITAIAPFYWGNTQSQTVTAWHRPIGYTQTQPTLFSVLADQSNSADYSNSDIIMACQSVGFADASKELKFEHLPAKVIVILTVNQNISDISSAIVKLTNLNLTSGAITAANTGITVASASSATQEIIPLLVSLSDDMKTLTVQALLPPQDVSTKQFIEVTIDGNRYIYTPAVGEGIFEAGKVYKYTIMVKG